MNREEVLDQDFNQAFQEYLLEKEGIVWTGSPKPGFNTALLENDGYFNVMTGPTSGLGIILSGLIMAGIIFYSQQNWIGFYLTVVIGLAVLILPDTVKYIRKQRTRYAFSRNRVFFKLWWWGKESTHFIDFKDIGKITYAEYDDKSGVLYFLPKTQFDFYTYDFAGSERRHYPTFEMVPNVVALWERMEKCRVERANNVNF